ncbi:phosphopentomutase/2,3-bisphosphoglycerate-independent phosphoglycerate mutase family metalloenzyme [Leeuwenhoekiella aestuarii]|uniref:2,3-bisphosphoglycerate-independent phosphoglycerate mutase family metalloenzyme n=1 Tax=Leeuwenhoekiella aestuarii TaxID=2249426 RepID=A0A4Q0NNG1_9FLAO|nr:alkaline phosphatase family protein [Leeuwenhoekiella aestuarii]RXG11319.1 2,3-bisphosphoglycerate-independent phosphoglycerate mutase family metalloenzyme [Leeuwenhoekiella aestuarii]RXG11857.1 phosphopentomutase/2,3-bisphosphoglycerate-independent phosphoglycerate mutase family metalloenzyme [Leeuwenhoekiella aestuarii]
MHIRKVMLLLLLAGLSVFKTQAQNKEDQKVILITLDGFRWQELFTGADPKLISNPEYVHDTTALKSKFWRETKAERREALLPFIWNEVVHHGEIHGNRESGSKVNLTNTMWFSYPGYNEILTGKADDKNIKSNDKIYNPNVTILEELNNTSKYKGKVAAFTSWDVFPYIINDKRSGIPVNAAFDPATDTPLSDREIFLNKLQKEIPSPWGSVRLDAFTHNYALAYMQKNHPSLVYIAYGETDDFAHDGEYDAYLNSAHTTDTMLKEVWEYVQADAFYKDQTTLIITTDHGRGTEPLETWKSHGSDIKGADQTWLIIFGAGADQKGAIQNEEQIYTTEVVKHIKQKLN